MFVTIFEPRELLHCVRSDISSEDPLSFRTKRFSVALATVIFIVLEAYSSFICNHSFISFSFISILVFFLFYLTRSVTFFSVYALCPVPLDDLGKPKGK
jgi:hypothetical protein